MKKKKIAILILAFIILGIIAGKCYKMPIHREVSATLYSLDGEKIDIVMDVSWHRFLFTPTELMGTIIVDNSIVYKDNVNTRSKTLSEFAYEMEKKMKGDTSRIWFVRQPVRELNDYVINCIYLPEAVLLDSFETIALQLVRDNVMKMFYGPAKTAEEAAELKKMLENSKKQ